MLVGLGVIHCVKLSAFERVFSSVAYNVSHGFSFEALLSGAIFGYLVFDGRREPAHRCVVRASEAATSTDEPVKSAQKGAVFMSFKNVSMNIKKVSWEWKTLMILTNLKILK